MFYRKTSTVTFPLILDDTLQLRPLTQADAEALFMLLEQNRAHLDQWLRWSGRVKTLDDARAYIGRFEQKLADADGFHLGIWFADQLVGGLGCHFLNRESNKTEIGYWLIANTTGKGLVTRAAKAVIDYLFATENMHRIEIQCGVENVHSRAVPERLGFVNEGVKRESDWITTRYVDHVMYSMLADEWKEKQRA